MSILKCLLCVLIFCMPGNPGKVKKAYEDAKRDFQTLHNKSINFSNVGHMDLMNSGKTLAAIAGAADNKKQIEKVMKQLPKKGKEIIMKEVDEVFEGLRDEDIATQIAVGLAYFEVFTDISNDPKDISRDQELMGRLIQKKLARVLGEDDREDAMHFLSQVKEQFDDQGEEKFQYLVDTFQAKEKKVQQEELIKHENKVKEGRLREDIEYKLVQQARDELVAYSQFSKPALQQPLSMVEINVIGEQIKGGIFRQDVEEKQLEDVVSDPMAVTHYVELLACTSGEQVVGYLTSLSPKEMKSFEHLCTMIETGGYVSKEGETMLFNDGVNATLVKKLKQASEYAVKKHMSDRAGVETYSRSEIKMIQIFFNLGVAVSKSEKDDQPHPDVANKYINIDGRMGKGAIEKYETNWIVMALELQSIKYGGLWKMLSELPDRTTRREVIGKFCGLYIPGRDWMMATESLQSELPEDQQRGDIEEKLWKDHVYKEYGNYLYFLIQSTLRPDASYSFPLAIPYSPILISASIPLDVFASHYEKQAERFNEMVKSTYVYSRGKVLEQEYLKMQGTISEYQKIAAEKSQQLQEKMLSYSSLIKDMGTGIKDYAGLLTLAGNALSGGETRKKLNIAYSDAFDEQGKILGLLDEMQGLREEIQDVYFQMVKEQFSYALLLGEEGEELKQLIVFTIIKTLGRSYLRKDHEIRLYAQSLYSSLPKDSTDKDVLGVMIGKKTWGALLVQDHATRETRDAFGQIYEDALVAQGVAVSSDGHSKEDYEKVLGVGYTYDTVQQTKIALVIFAARTEGGGNSEHYFDLQHLYDTGISNLSQITQLLEDDDQYTDVKLGFVGYEDMLQTHAIPSEPSTKYKVPVYKPTFDNLRLYAKEQSTGKYVAFTVPHTMFTDARDVYRSYWLKNYKAELASPGTISSYFEQEKEKAQVLEREPILLELGDRASEMNVLYKPFFEMMKQLQSGDAGAVTKTIQTNMKKVQIPALLSFNQEMVDLLENKEFKDHLSKMNLKDVLGSDNSGLYIDGSEKYINELLSNTNMLVEFFSPGGTAEQTIRFFQNEKNRQTPGANWRDRLIVLCVVIFVSVSLMMATGGLAGIFLGAAGGMVAHEGMVREMNHMKRRTGYIPYQVGSSEFTTYYQMSSPLIAWNNGEMADEDMLQAYGKQFVMQLAFQFGAIGFGKFIGGPLWARLKGATGGYTSKFLGLIDDIAGRGSKAEQQFYSKFLGEYTEEMLEESTLEQIAGEIHPPLQYLVMMCSASKGGGGPTALFDYYGLSFDTMTFADNEGHQSNGGGGAPKIESITMSVNASHIDAVREMMQDWSSNNDVLEEHYSADGNVITLKTSDGLTLTIQANTLPGGFRQHLGSYVEYVQPTESDGTYHITQQPERVKRLLEAGGYRIINETDGSFEAYNLYGETLSCVFDVPLETQLLRRVETFQQSKLLETIRATPDYERTQEQNTIITELRYGVMKLPPEHNETRLRIGMTLLGRDALTPQERDVILQAHATPSRVGTYRVLRDSGLFAHDEMRTLTFRGVCGERPIRITLKHAEIMKYNTFLEPAVDSDDLIDHKFHGLLYGTEKIDFENLMTLARESNVKIPVTLLQSGLFIDLLKYIDRESIPLDIFSGFTARDFEWNDQFPKDRNSHFFDLVTKTEYDKMPKVIRTLVHYTYINESGLGYGMCSELPSTMMRSIYRKSGCVVRQGDSFIGYTKIDQHTPTSLQLINGSRQFVSFPDAYVMVMHDIRNFMRKMRVDANEFSTTDWTLLSQNQKTMFLETYSHPLVKQVGVTPQGILCVELNQNTVTGSKQHDDLDIVGQSNRGNYSLQAGVGLMNDMRGVANEQLGTDSQRLDILPQDIAFEWLTTKIFMLKEEGIREQITKRDLNNNPEYLAMIDMIRNELNDDQRHQLAEDIIGRPITDSMEIDIIIIMHVNSLALSDSQKYELLRNVFSEEEAMLLMRRGVCGTGKQEKERMEQDEQFMKSLKKIKREKYRPNYFTKGHKELSDSFDLEMWRIWQQTQGRGLEFRNMTRAIHDVGYIGTLPIGDTSYRLETNRNSSELPRMANFSVSLMDTSQSPPQEIAIMGFAPGPGGTLDIVQMESIPGANLPASPAWQQAMLEKITLQSLAWGFAGVRVLTAERNGLYLYGSDVNESNQDRQHEMRDAYTTMPQETLGFIKDDEFGRFSQYLFNETSDIQALYRRHFEERYSMLDKTFSDFAEGKLAVLPFDRYFLMKVRSEFIQFTNSTYYTGNYKRTFPITLSDFEKFSKDSYREVNDFCKNNNVTNPEAPALYLQMPELMKYKDVKDFPPPNELKRSMYITSGGNGHTFSFRTGELIKIPKPKDQQLAEGKTFTAEIKMHDFAYGLLKEGHASGAVSRRIRTPEIFPQTSSKKTPYTKMELIYGFDLKLHEKLIGRIGSIASLMPKYVHNSTNENAMVRDDVLTHIEEFADNPNISPIIRLDVEETVVDDLKKRFAGIRDWARKLQPSELAILDAEEVFVTLYVLQDMPEYAGLYDALVDATKFMLTQKPGLAHHDYNPWNFMLEFNESTQQYDLVILDYGLATKLGR